MDSETYSMRVRHSCTQTHLSISSDLSVSFCYRSRFRVTMQITMSPRRIEQCEEKSRVGRGESKERERKRSRDGGRKWENKLRHVTLHIRVCIATV